MHVKTDVFCAAGITLPDKAGRILNVGGWANDATYGVRLYWPDGTPGSWGVNDWHENVLEVSLQKGRWYPSGMVMTNGSILIVGGEEGSNGAPVPSLEVLPVCVLEFRSPSPLFFVHLFRREGDGGSVLIRCDVTESTRRRIPLLRLPQSNGSI